jgi:hypothetical protein
MVLVGSILKLLAYRSIIQSLCRVNVGADHHRFFSDEYHCFMIITPFLKFPNFLPIYITPADKKSNPNNHFGKAGYVKLGGLNIMLCADETIFSRKIMALRLM